VKRNDKQEYIKWGAIIIISSQNWNDHEARGCSKPYEEGKSYGLYILTKTYTHTKRQSEIKLVDKSYEIIA